MKKLVAPLWLAIIALALSGNLALAAAVSAPDTGVGPAGQDLLKFLGQTAKKGGLTSDPDAPTKPTTIISAVVNTVLGVVGVIFFIQMFYAGIRWMTAEGAEQVIKEAKDTIRNALIGIVIVMSAFIITNFVLNRLERINQGAATTSGGASTGGATATTGACLDRDGQCIGNYVNEAECLKNGGDEFDPSRKC